MKTKTNVSTFTLHYLPERRRTFRIFVCEQTVVGKKSFPISYVLMIGPTAPKSVVKKINANHTEILIFSHTIELWECPAVDFSTTRSNFGSPPDYRQLDIW